MVFNRDDDELEVLLGGALLLDCDHGTSLIRKGHVSRTIFVLLDGALSVRDAGRSLARNDAPGSIVGEVALCSKTERLADVVVDPGGARVLALSERNLRRLLAGGGPVATKFLLTLTRGLCLKLHERAAIGG